MEKFVDNAVFQELIQRVDSRLCLMRADTMTPDASARRYFRLHVRPALPSGAFSCVAMVLDSVRPAEVCGSESIPTDRAYVELSEYFGSAGLAVPELLLDARADSVLLLEDLGDTLLADFLTARPAEELVDSVLAQATAQIVALQQLPVADFPYQRAFTAELYMREMDEFVTFFLASQSAIVSNDAYRELASAIAASLGASPYVVVHRDFHCWNLLVTASNKVRVIDFQDALFGSRFYDIVSLLHDRGIDITIGQSRVRQLRERFFADCRYPDADFEEYLLVSVQRDLKVIGRFAKLVGLGKPQYGKWIAPTIARLRSTLDQLSAEFPKTAIIQLRDLLRPVLGASR